MDALVLVSSLEEGMGGEGRAKVGLFQTRGSVGSVRVRSFADGHFA